VSSITKLDFNFVNSLPFERISHYALFDFDKRLTLRNHSYACDELNKGIQTFRAFSRMGDLFTDKTPEVDGS
jgi:hypothetical protein